MNKIKNSASGQGLVEYGLILALVSIAAILILMGLGFRIDGNFGLINEKLGFGSPTSEVEKLPELEDYDINLHLADGDTDFKWVDRDGDPVALDEPGHFAYVGTATEVTVPHIIQGKDVVSYDKMFEGTNVEVVHSDNPNITTMNEMFSGSTAPSISLKYFDTSNVTAMQAMFAGAQASAIDIRYFNTSKIEAMASMFSGTQNIESLDLRYLDYDHLYKATSHVLGNLFGGAKIGSIDMSTMTLHNYSANAGEGHGYPFIFSSFSGVNDPTLVVYVGDEVTGNVLRHMSPSFYSTFKTAVK